MEWKKRQLKLFIKKNNDTKRRNGDSGRRNKLKISVLATHIRRNGEIFKWKYPKGGWNYYLGC